MSDRSTPPDPAHSVLNYLRALSRGAPPDLEFESLELTAEMEFDTLDMAVVLHELAKERSISLAEELETAPSLPGAEDYSNNHQGWSSFCNLYERLSVLSESFALEEATALLRSGVVGPGNEVRPLHEALTVRVVVDYCRRLGLID